MIRPCFLVVNREHPASISTRKLVIETAKLNVLTAYSGEEAFETLQVFPSVHGAVLDGLMTDIRCAELIEKLHSINPELPIVVVGGAHCEGAVRHIDHYDPQALLNVLKGLQPRASKMIDEHDEELLSKLKTE